MKEYIKPSVQVIDMKVKDNVTAKNGTGYYVSGGKITYYHNNASFYLLYKHTIHTEILCLKHEYIIHSNSRNVNSFFMFLATCMKWGVQL